jgi:hypothetical protein
MKGVAVLGISIMFLVNQALAAGIYTGSDGQQVALGGFPKVIVNDGKISGSDLTAILEANFKIGKKIISNSTKVGLPTFNEFEGLVENLSAGVQGKELAEKSKQEAQSKGWGSLRVGQKDGDYYSVAVVIHGGKAEAAKIICNSQLMLTSTGPDKAMNIE